MSTQPTTTTLAPAIIVIFGITGDLSKRYLLPALYHLFKDNLLHEQTVILGVTRQDISAQSLLDDVELCVNEIDGICDPQAVQKLRDRLQMLQLDISSGEAYDTLLQTLNKFEDDKGMCMNRLYYLSIPPQVTGSIITLLGEHGLNASCQHGTAATRLLIEKPFGYDLASAEELIETISRQFGEEQLYRIDHYVAKETVQNILTFRDNNLFEAMWNSQHISHVLITAAEAIDIEGRVNFYDHVGALRDLVQSHLLQLLATVSLDLPATITSETLHQAKLTVLQAVHTIPADKIAEVSARGQYEGYRDDIGNNESITETFAALKVEINNERWSGVPFLIRSGKALAERLTEIRVVFRPQHEGTPANILTFRIQPDESIELDLQAKQPGFDYAVQSIPMTFSYQQVFDDHGHPNAYERVLVDAVKGDHTLFATSSEVIAAWRIIEPLVEAWGRDGNGLEIYPKKSWGPSSSEELAKRNGTDWNGKTI